MSVNCRNPKMIRAALIDLSGTLHVGATPIPGAVQAIQRLENAGIPTLALTNTSKISSDALKQQLLSMGFSSLEIMTSTIACRTYLQRNNLRPYCLLESVDDFKQHLPLEPLHDCVVVGLAPSKLDYSHLNQAFHILNNKKDSKLICIHKSMYYRDDSHELSLGPGGFISCLEQASGKEALVIGKPNPAFYQAALQQLGVLCKDVVMVGDDVLADICGAREAGIETTILVKTGKYKEGDEIKAPDDCVVVTSIVQAVDYILDHHST